MQIVYLGLAGEARIEAEAGVQLLRLMRFGQWVSHCRLIVEARNGPTGRHYNARMEIVTAQEEEILVPGCSDAEPEPAVRAVFDYAERELTARAADLSRLNKQTER